MANKLCLVARWRLSAGDLGKNRHCRRPYRVEKEDDSMLQPWIQPVSQALADGVVKPVVHAVVPFAGAAEAHRILAARENIGKVVLVP